MNNRSRWRLVVLVSVASFACAPVVDIDEPSPFEEDDPAAFADGSAQEAGEPTMAIAAPDPCRRARPPVRRRTIPVTRADLIRVLDAGPGPLLRGLELKPHFVERRFAGWEIVRFMPCEVRFDGLDLRPGDVVGRVNEQSIVRPEHLADLWPKLRTARIITVEVTGARGDFVLRFEVADDANSATP